MPKLSLAGAVGLLILVGGPIIQVNSQTPSPADSGRGDFMNYCAACHGVSGIGDGTVAEFLTLSAANLTQMSVKNGGIFPRQRAIEVERAKTFNGDFFQLQQVVNHRQPAAQRHRPDFGGERRSFLEARGSGGIGSDPEGRRHREGSVGERREK